MTEVEDYDLFPLSNTSIGTSASDLYLDGIPTTSGPVMPANYKGTVYNAAITNTGTSTAVITIQEATTIAGAPTPIVLYQISLAAGATEPLSQQKFKIMVDPGYKLQALVSAGTASIQSLMYFSKA